MFQQFAHREQATSTATLAAMNNYHAFQKNRTEATAKQEHSFIVIPGGSGSGKTRAACEIEFILREQGKKGNVCSELAVTCTIAPSRVLPYKPVACRFFQR